MSWQPVAGIVLEHNALLAAKEENASLAVTAGPGAGKTELLAQRADFLLRTGKCRYPKRILAISFKVDASANLRDRVQNRCRPELASRLDSYTFHAFAKRIIDRFRPVLTGPSALDADYEIVVRRQSTPRKQLQFNELIPRSIEILEKSVVARNALRHTYSDVFLDEFQDCTAQQYELLKLAFHGTGVRLIAVGDTKQRIMGWAGALEGIFETYASDFSARPLNLYSNHRSLPRLRRMQNELIRVLDPKSSLPDDEITGDGGDIAVESFTDSLKEAKYLARCIQQWITADKLSPADIAVLIPKQPHLYGKDLMTHLAERSIPFRNDYELQDLLAEPAAQIMLDFLACVFCEREPDAWTRLINQLDPFQDDTSNSRARSDIGNLIGQYRNQASRKGALKGPSEVIDQVRDFLRRVGTEKLVALSPDYESQPRLAEIIQSTEDLISEAIIMEADIPTALARINGDNAVRILTIHKSKGLEFDTVVMLGVEDQTFWGDVEVERCVYFVGISRAKRRLVLTSSDLRERPTGFSGRWEVNRSRHQEFTDYALRVASNSPRQASARGHRDELALSD